MMKRQGWIRNNILRRWAEALTAWLREVLLGNRRGKTVRFSPTNQMDVNPSDLENGQILQLQQRIIDGKNERTVFDDRIVCLIIVTKYRSGSEPRSIVGIYSPTTRTRHYDWWRAGFACRIDWRDRGHGGQNRCSATASSEKARLCRSKSKRQQ